jgi:hypothetical protein
LVNEQNRSIVELWDGVNRKCTFRRCVNTKLFLPWEEVVSIVESLEFYDDEMVWQFHYSSQTLYDVVNFRGVTPIFLPVVWKLNIPLGYNFSCDWFHKIRSSPGRTLVRGVLMIPPVCSVRNLNQLLIFYLDALWLL